MSDEARLNELLDLVEQARAEGDKETEAKAIAAYRQASVPGATAKDRTLAVASGINAGAANTVGMPMDALINVKDLLNAGVGYVASKATGKPPPDFTAPTDRPNIPLSSDWFKKHMNKVSITEPPRPDDTASRWIHGGTALGSGIYFGSAIPGQTANRPITPMRPSPNAQSQSSASVNVGPSSSYSQSVLQATPSASLRGGGSSFGYVGDDAVTGLTQGQKQAAEAGKRLGMRLTPGQATGNKSLQRLEAKMESQPMTAGPFDRIKDVNQKKLNEAWARMIGENSDNINSDVLAKASDRIGKVFDDVRDDVMRPIDPQSFVTKMRDVADEFEAIAPSVWKNPLVERLVRHAEDGGATGKDLGNLTSKLGREANKHMTTQGGDRELGMALFKVKDYVDDLVEQGLTGGRKADYQAARQEYRNLQLLTQRVNTLNPVTGNVNGTSLGNLLQAKDRSGYLFGKKESDAYDAVKFAQGFKPIVGDSGTATRSPITAPLDLLLKFPVNLAARAYTSSPSVDAAVAAQAATHAAGRGLSAVGDATGVTSPMGLLFGVPSLEEQLRANSARY